MKTPKKSKQALNFAYWNVRTMLDKADSSCPERRSALIVHELSCLNIDMAALSKICFVGKGSLKEHGAGYTLYWSGKPSTERRLSGEDSW